MKDEPVDLIEAVMVVICVFVAAAIVIGVFSCMGPSTCTDNKIFKVIDEDGAIQDEVLGVGFYETEQGVIVINSCSPAPEYRHDYLKTAVNLKPGWQVVELPLSLERPGYVEKHKR